MMRANGMVDSVDATTSDPVKADINSGHTFSTNVLRSGDYVDHIFVSSDVDVLGWEQLVRIEAPVDNVGAATPTTAIPGIDLTLR